MTDRLRFLGRINTTTYFICHSSTSFFNKKVDLDLTRRTADFVPSTSCAIFDDTLPTPPVLVRVWSVLHPLQLFLTTSHCSPLTTYFITHCYFSSMTQLRSQSSLEHRFWHLEYLASIYRKQSTLTYSNLFYNLNKILFWCCLKPFQD